MKLAASDLFKDKKQAYPASVPQPYITSHLCKLNIYECTLIALSSCLLHLIL